MRMKLLRVFCLVGVLLSIPLSQLGLSTAASESLVLYQVQVGGDGSGTASEELVILYNVSDEDILVEGWCIEYSSGSNGVSYSNVACIESEDSSVELFVEASGMVSFATQQFVSKNTSFTPDFLFSAGLAGSSGHVRIVDSDGQELDRLGWGSAVSPETLAADVHTDGEVMSRDLDSEFIDTDDNSVDFSSMAVVSEIVSGLYESEVLIDICKNIDELQLEVPEGYLQDELGDCYIDQCSNVDGLQKMIPDGFSQEGLICEEIPLEDSTIFITELYPNAPSYDSGNEFIELYNPNPEAINLDGYVLQIGPSYSKEYVFDSEIIGSGEYKTFSDTETGIILPNSSGVPLRLIAPAGNTVSSTDAYQNAEDNTSWALLEDTNQITPDAANKPSVIESEAEVLGVTTVYAPCPAGKFRNPETNRCKSISSAASSQLVPCKENQYRNPDTNRCKAVESASLDPCPEGQERSEETNRCRNVAAITDSNISKQIIDIDTSGVQTTNWFVVFMSILGTIVYILYEWRVEIRRKYRALKLSV